MNFLEKIAFYSLFLVSSFCISASLFGQNQQNEVYIGGWVTPGNSFSPQTISTTNQNHVDILGWSVQKDGHIICNYPAILPRQLSDIVKAKMINKNFKASFAISEGLNYLLNEDFRVVWNFFNDLKRIVKENRFDGVTLDWEWPLSGKERQTTTFLHMIKRSFPPNFILSIAVGYSPEANRGYDFTNLDFIDYFEMMDYDMSGVPNGICETSLLSLLENIKEGVEAYIALGIPSNKLISIFPLYGYAWNGVVPGPDMNGLGQIGNCYDSLRYSQVIELAKQNPDNIYYQNQVDSWYYDPLTDFGSFIQFQSTEAIDQKTKVLSQLKIGGVSVFSQVYDTSTGEGLYKIASKFLENKQPDKGRSSKPNQI